MPIGLVTAGAAVLGAGATIYASSQASHAQTKAADQASQVAQTTAANNNQLARDMYASNAARLDPYSSMGLAAGDEYTGLLLGPQSTHVGSGWAPTNALATATPAAGSAPASGYSGPSLQQILNGGTQQQMDAYLGYYQAHPSEDPGFTTISPFHGDPFVDESSANSVLAARSAYQTAHPATPAAPAPNAIAPVVAQQAQQAIAAGADPAAVQARAMQYGVHL